RWSSLLYAIGAPRERFARESVRRVFAGGEESSFRNGLRGGCLARRPSHRNRSNRRVRANAHDHRRGILRGPAIPAAMFANECFVAKVHRDARAIAIPTSEFFGGSRGPIPADEADGNHAASQARLAHF